MPTDAKGLATKAGAMAVVSTHSDKIADFLDDGKINNSTTNADGTKKSVG